jgi:regulator of sigma E protease
MTDILYAVVAAVIGLGVLIVVHELGHFLVAKKLGVGVVTFSIGFGPKLWGRRVGETEYVVSAFPLGGYVKMVGEEPGEELAPAEREKSFSHQSVGRRAAIVAAGPAFNLLLAVLILALAFVAFGVPRLTTRVGSVEEGSPAAAAGLRPGDRIVEVEGQAIASWEALSEKIRGSGGKPLRVRIERGDEVRTVTIQPTRREARTVFGEPREVWLIGITSEIRIERSPPWAALARAVYRTGEYCVLTLVALYKMVTGDVSPKNLGGPLMIAQMAGEQAQVGLESFLIFVALLSVNLGVLNLLPIPVLDGGHLFFFLFEWLRGRPLEIGYREKAQQIGIFILIVVMVYAFYNDVTRFFE